MEIGKTQTGFGQRIEVGCIDFSAKSAQIGKAPVVGHQYHEIRSRCARARFPGRWRHGP